MADFRYFADFNGEPMQLTNIRHNGSPYKPKAAHFTGTLPNGERVTAERMVQFKFSMPKLHKCDARCLHATGKTMNCECSCGGKNHGRGAMVCS